MTRLLQSAQCNSCEFFLDQYVVSVVSGDRKNRNVIRRKWLYKREENTRLRERKRAFEFEADPAMQGLNISRNVIRQTNNGEFICRVSYRMEFTIDNPVRNRRVRRKAHDRIQSGELAELELLALP